MIEERNKRIMITVTNRMLNLLNDVRLQHLKQTDVNLSRSNLIARIIGEWSTKIYDQHQTIDPPPIGGTPQ